MAQTIKLSINEYKESMRRAFGNNWIRIADFTKEKPLIILKKFLSEHNNSFDLVSSMIKDTTCTNSTSALFLYVYAADAQKGEQFRKLRKLISERTDISEETKELLA